jgi:predicted Fe-Mo cluster-binding NifX family protein
MIVLVSAQQPRFDSPIDERFGRSSWLVRIETDSMKWDAFPNPGSSQSGGAGVAAAQFVIDQKANTVISGDFGPHAASAFRAANIEMRLFTAEITSIQQAIEHFQQGRLPVFT